ncbi:uncharacterized protein EI97DRAFT_438588 [Westerdykella ornata]|uniref:Uncharacterized protein n=1 Tax=Westerdykella ornata TaxID=318751 RepID=A0A6A6JXR2_WESOR|nr:uncharacterized protein EI97DRAFT_438588 [Westerdykella ornata]KAF2281197.1 hypothetical protein EI97DRAFT_438588 [Westerdykella ornata]
MDPSRQDDEHKTDMKRMSSPCGSSKSDNDRHTQRAMSHTYPGPGTWNTPAGAQWSKRAMQLHARPLCPTWTFAGYSLHEWRSRDSIIRSGTPVTTITAPRFSAYKNDTTKLLFKPSQSHPLPGNHRLRPSSFSIVSNTGMDRSVQPRDRLLQPPNEELREYRKSPQYQNALRQRSSNVLSVVLVNGVWKDKETTQAAAPQGATTPATQPAIETAPRTTRTNARSAPQTTPNVSIHELESISIDIQTSPGTGTACVQFCAQNSHHKPLANSAAGPSTQP